jgi:hypothetical protein
LEEVNALALDAGQTRPLPEHEENVAESLSTIQQLIEHARSTFASCS